jgi:chorismate mutase
MNILNIKDWDLNIIKDNGAPYLISGPCSAESREQVLKSCIGAVEQGADILRAGIWKPRTRPNSFEGLGQIALPWLKEAGLQTGKPVCTEIATPEHAEAALKAGIDVLWLGARTTVNPFAVQEIADALKGVDIPVMIKNPINPDLELWIGGIERIARAGVTKIAAIHRGFSVYNAPKYRNQPQWEIPIELKRRIPQLEIINDPSHIAGKRVLLQEIAQHALDLNFSGLMIESHINPEEAWSDAKQQVTPKDLGILLRSLQPKKEKISLNTDDLVLEKLRKAIDEVDYKLVNTLAERMEIVKHIGQYKKENNIAILQIERWNKVRDNYIQNSLPHLLNQAFILEFIDLIHRASLDAQKKIID